MDFFFFSSFDARRRATHSRGESLTRAQPEPEPDWFPEPSASSVSSSVSSSFTTCFSVPGGWSREQFGRVQLSRVYCCRSLFSSLLSRMYCIALEQVRPDELVYRGDDGRTARGTGPARRGEARRGSPFWRANLSCLWPMTFFSLPSPKLPRSPS